MRPRRLGRSWPGVALAALLLAGCGGGRTAPARSITIGGEVTGTLRSTDPRLGTDNTAYHIYTFRGNAGQTVQIDVMSRDFDAYAVLQDELGTQLASNDDGGEGFDARITYTLPGAALYRVVVNTFRRDQYGAYRLRIAGLPTGAARSGTVIQRGVRMTGRLTPSDPRMSDNAVFHYFIYNGRAGELITVDVMSRDFDAFAIIQDASGNELIRDDDNGDGTNARITFRLPYQGQFRIVATTYTAGSFGAYTVWVH